MEENEFEDDEGSADELVDEDDLEELASQKLKGDKAAGNKR